MLLLAFLAPLAAVVGLAAMANGNHHDSATVSWATGIGLVSGPALLALRGRPTDGAERLVHALSGLVAAVALCLPAIWTLIYQVSTPGDDTSGCGSISTPVQFFDPVGRQRKPDPDVRSDSGTRRSTSRGSLSRRS